MSSRNTSEGLRSRKKVEDDLPSESHQAEKTVTQSSRDGCSLTSKALILIFMSLNNSSITVLIHYTRNNVTGPMYMSSTAVLLVEVVKLSISFLVLLYQSKSVYKFMLVLFKQVICRPVEFLEVSIPALFYAVQNSLIFTALQHLDPATYQVSLKFRIFTTALLMRLILKKRLSTLQWFSLVLLFIGVVAVNIKPEIFSQFQVKSSWNYFMGFGTVIICCLCSSFAGVYFEKMLKKDSVSFWIRNVAMYCWGIVAITFSIYMKDYDQIGTQGFFYGYNSFTWILIGIQSLGGICASLVIKYLDNLFKTLGSAGGVLISSLISYTFFNTELHLQFFCGTICVFMAMFLYLSK